MNLNGERQYNKREIKEINSLSDCIVELRQKPFYILSSFLRRDAGWCFLKYPDSAGWSGLRTSLAGLKIFGFWTDLTQSGFRVL